ncbi:MAG: Asp-tRNA(Asn)/Glu-tRNA(Gln) amidotransferase subunit GatB, partial [Persicimonas sp.]
MNDTHQNYQPVIGLEVHVQLQTDSKVFSPASAAYGADPNTRVAEVDLGLPGALPVLNRRAVEFAMRAGLALNCNIRPTSRFARKNYFYPDLPKGYQISQFELPLCEDGHLEVDVDGDHTRRVGIERIHMEEDAGKSTHLSNRPYSLVDLNRAGVPLIEIVTRPDLRSADEAVAFLKELRNIVVYLGISDGNMQEGSFRCDSNVSVRPEGSEELGTRTELKNINSFKFIKDAINYEIERQIELVESGEEVVQQTRLYNPDRGETFAMRSKEEAHDYR